MEVDQATAIKQLGSSELSGSQKRIRLIVDPSMERDMIQELNGLISQESAKTRLRRLTVSPLSLLAESTNV